MLRGKKHGNFFFVLSTFSIIFRISETGSLLTPDEVYTHLKSNFEFEIKRLRVNFNRELNRQELAIENRLEETKKEISEAIENRLEDLKKEIISETLAKSKENVRKNSDGHTGQILNSADLSRLTKHKVIMDKAFVDEKRYLRDTVGRLEKRLINVEQTILNIGEGNMYISTKGQKGERGFPGLQGLEGPKGMKGDVGEEGLPGPRGRQGFKGVKGFRGRPRLKGKKGESSIKGNMYIVTKRQKGERGFSDLQGLEGPKGMKGDVGAAGPPGPRGRQGFKGEPGMDGLAGLSGLPGIPGSEGEKGEKGESSITTEPVSFSARMIGNDLPLRSNERLIFNEVINNVMNGYNSKTGVFSAPVSGVYLFLYFIEVSEAYGEVHLVVGGKKVSSARAYGGTEINIRFTGSSNRITFSENGPADLKRLQCVTGEYSVIGSGNYINIQLDKYCMQGDFSAGVGSNSVLTYVSKNEQVWLETPSKDLTVHFKPFGTAFTGVLLYEH